MSVSKKLGIGAAAAAMLAGVSASKPAEATVTYDYVGNSFTSVKNAALGPSLDASVTFDNTVTSNFTGSVDAYDIEAYTLSGVGSGISVSSPSAITLTSSFGFLNGQINSWNLYAKLGTTLAGTENYYIVNVGAYIQDTIIDGVQNYNIGSAGTWTKEKELSAVPAPEALPMFAATLAGMVGYGRWKRATPTNTPS